MFLKFVRNLKVVHSCNKFVGSPILTNRVANFRKFSNLKTHDSHHQLKAISSLKKEFRAQKFSTSKTDYLPKYKIAKLPSLSPTMDTGTVVSWEKQIGDKLEEGDVLAEIETDKAVMSMETPYQGYLAKIIKSAGSQNIQINEPIAIIVSKEEDIASFENVKMSELELGIAPTPSEAKTESTQINNTNPENYTISVETDRVIASPYAKKIARENNIDLNDIGVSGGRRIVSSDVLNLSMQENSKTAVDNSSSTVKPEFTSGKFVDIPLTNMRKVIATRLSKSKQSIPHYYLTCDINMDNLIKLRAEFNEKLQKDGTKLSLNDFIIKATGICLTVVPELNSAWMDDFIRQYKNVDINMAVSTDTGLITPFIRDVNMKGLVQISQESKVLVKKARENKLALSEFQGGTFTITNLGMFGIKSFSAIINPPQCAILAIGGIAKVIAPDHENKPSLQNIMAVTLCADHRVIDGAIGATWIKHFKHLLEDPVQMLL